MARLTALVKPSRAALYPRGAILPRDMAPLPRQSSRPPSTRRHFTRSFYESVGLAQLSVVEHALCPLDPAAGMTPNLRHRARYHYTDRNGHQQSASASVLCPSGLSPNDEFYLWGLLALTLSQPDPSLNFHATPHYCLRQLGCIDRRTDRGGKQYDIFRDAIGRLSEVSYRNDRFFDPVRAEHRQVAFGFISYSLPLGDDSSRAWRFAWDPIFFEFASATKGRLSFDLATYRQLGFASRRLFLLLQKIFWRHDISPAFDVRELCVEVLGFAPTIPMPQLKQKLLRCVDQLLGRDILTLPLHAPAPAMLFEKTRPGRYRIRFHRGTYFSQEAGQPPRQDTADSPLLDPLRAIGFDDAAIRRFLRTYKPHLLQEWADITLAALERNGPDFFSVSPQAYFVDNIRHAAAGTRTPPDWWRDLRREEERRRHENAADRFAHGSPVATEKAFDEYLRTEAKAAFERVMDRVFADLRTAGQSEADAREHATYVARMNLRPAFRRDHPEHDDGDGPARAGALFNRGS
jgi:hypothetical protein